MTGATEVAGLKARRRAGWKPAILGALSALVLAACASIAPPPARTIAPLPELTLAARNTTLRLAVVGDVGNGTAKIASGIAAIHSSNPLDGILLTGDNVYPCGIQSVDDPRWRVLDPLLAIGVPVFPVLGNHDHCGNEQAQIEWSARDPRWRLIAPQYLLRAGVADFAMIDTTPFARGRSADAATAIREGLSGSHAAWRIVVGHHTIISSGWHGWFPRDEVRRMRGLLPELRRLAVDLYVCGHDHDLELVDGNPRFLVSGAGSDPIPIVVPRSRFIYPRRPSFREPLGFAEMEITPAVLRIRFHGADGAALSGWYAFGAANQSVTIP